ncbi:hypothetical protein [Pseudomonas gingeri]|nr:hypothetical protein [Pseudomonas gingeri]NWA01269.1 hypothetical protein [Pseudomonas gingeri]NWA17605.1 hypothetical protein [Pseudomonas gingeri]NWA57042.1 hypothetical protein [Pseudomonas gingeri]NWA97013.1 hypothetical protein [Pseudomonas gingeri]NWB05455.1 hypothetical protein [Pseudomonas gingeri]
MSNMERLGTATDDKGETLSSLQSRVQMVEYIDDRIPGFPKPDHLAQIAT